jgi:hypothetical protein
MPRFIIFVRANSDAESGLTPSTDIFEAMAAYNATLVEAGVMLSGEGLLASSRDSRRIAFHNSSAPTVQSGPFPTNELVSGWWILKVKDIEAAVSWAIKCPFKEGAVTEVRRIAESEDFGDALSPELKAKEEEIRAQAEKLAKAE